jgi:ABC-type antimicrobial peptide transport system permease subunit
MFVNYFKTAWRNFVNNKVLGSINILGLGIGMAVSMLICLWVFNEYSFNKFLPDHDRVYQVRRNFNSNGTILNFKTTSLALGEALRNEVPEIEYVAETDWMGPHGLTYAGKKLYIDGAITGLDFLKIFQYPLVKGNPLTVFADPYSIVLTESTALSMFGTEDPMLKTIRFDNKHDLKVTGILKDLPENSTFRFKYLVPFSLLDNTRPAIKELRTGSFSANSFQQFVKLRKDASYDRVSEKIKNIQHRQDNINARNSLVILQPMDRWHLFADYENGKDARGLIEYVRLFSCIAGLVLLIACINFINLATARSEKRAREVGVRKAIGSDRKALIIQFLTESFFYTVTASVISLFLVMVALPWFNSITGRSIVIPLSNPGFWMLLLACILITALAAGTRPAIYLSGFSAVRVLKGSITKGKAATLPRKALVVLQFTCSIALIISTIIVYRQIGFARSRPIGYNYDRLLMTDMSEDLQKNFVAMKQELLQRGVIENMATSSGPVTNINWHTDIDNWPGKNSGETIEMGAIVVSEDYFKTVQMNFASGRNFSGPDDSTTLIFNETAISQMRLKDPLNQKISWDEAQFSIKGVVKDALMTSPYAPAEPTMFVVSPDHSGILLYRLAKNISTPDALKVLNEVFAKYNPSRPYEYMFTDDSYASKFNFEMLVGKLAGIFAALAIFVSCLGLFGLAAYVAEQRSKEIGIRKVLGANLPQIWMLISRDFILLVLISSLVASPLAYFFLQNWLEKYSYRVEIGVEVFVIAALLALVVAVITVSFQSIKAALANPVRNLRAE